MLSGRGILDGIDFLLRHAGGRLRLVLLTRVDPALPLHRYRLAGSVTEVRLDELAFTPVEARAVLTAHDVDCRSDGERPRRGGAWVGCRPATGCAGAPAPIGNRRPSPPATISEIADYFRAEFLDVQPPGIREFLLRTSVVDRIWPALAVSLTGRRDAAPILARLAHANTFVTPSAEGSGGYEYHPLIRELLRAQLREESPRKDPSAPSEGGALAR